MQSFHLDLPSSEIDWQQHNERKYGHFYNTSQSQSMETEENKRVKPYSIDDLHFMGANIPNKRNMVSLQM